MGPDGYEYLDLAKCPHDKPLAGASSYLLIEVLSMFPEETEHMCK